MFVAQLQTLFFEGALQSTYSPVKLASASPEDWGYSLSLRQGLPHARCLRAEGTIYNK